MDTIIKGIILFGIGAGIIDVLLGNRWKTGEKFQQGFHMMGSMMISMTGVMAIVPAIANLVKPAIVPVFCAVHLDPSVLSIILSCDMGGYQMAMSLGENPSIALLMGIVVAGTLGGTLTFTIPLGYKLIANEDVPFFSKGLLIGVSCIPVASIVSGLMLGIPVGLVVWNSLPILALTLCILIGMRIRPQKMIAMMEKLGRIVECLGMLGIGAACVEYLTGKAVVPGMEPLMDMMLVVCQMTVTLIGMYPALELLSRALRKPLSALGAKVGLDDISILGMIFIMVSSVPVFPTMKQMPRKGVVVNTVWIVLVSGIFGSQLGLVMSVCPEILPAFFAGKFVAALVAVSVALLGGSRRPAAAQNAEVQGI